MELIERTLYIDQLNRMFRRVEQGTGHAVFLMGEAGVGKTSLANHFIESLSGKANCYIGACDSLFTPRPLGPLYDIAVQMGGSFAGVLTNERDRADIFSAFLQIVSSSTAPIVVLFEDVHWADEATIDFIKFLSRRITRAKCLFMLTFRDNEAHAPHPLSTLFGQLVPDTFTKVHVDTLSREAVNKMAVAKGYGSGEKIYSLTGGNPFYVTEILANGSLSVPDRVKDSIITTFHSKDDKMRELWELLSILPSRIDFKLIEKIEPEYPNGIEDAIKSGVIVNRNEYLAFKHELFRIAIEESLSRYRRRNLHSKILKIMLESSAPSTLAQLVHHARSAEDREQIANLAPQAGREAAAVGAHVEAARFYHTAIEFASASDPLLADHYSSFAYECYLINQIESGVRAQEKALELWKASGTNLKIGDSMRFLSRLNWFAGERAKASALAHASIEVLEPGGPTRELALAYSNLSQLNMLADNLQNTIHWGEKAIELAQKMDDPEILSHALNNVGSIVMKKPGREVEGLEMLSESLSIALKHGLQEHAARAYTNAGCFHILIRQYQKGKDWLERGLKYCEDRDLLSWYYYLVGEKTRLLVDQGDWTEAEHLAISLRQNPENLKLTKIGATVSLARLKIRHGEFAEARNLIEECKVLAAPTAEAYRVMPVIQAELELCWTSKETVDISEVNAAIALLPDIRSSWHYTGIAFWMRKCGLNIAPDDEVHYPGPFKLQANGDWLAAAKQWNSIGCPFEYALTLMEGDEEHQRNGLAVLDQLGATATSEMFKTQLRESGMRNIPRGPRESTRNNPAQLTTRQIEILKLLKDGTPNKEIAEKLFISTKTVDHHISAILSKLEVNSRARAVVEAQKLGILK